MDKKVLLLGKTMACWLEMLIISLVSGYFLVNFLGETYKKTENISYLAEKNKLWLFMIMGLIAAAVLVVSYFSKNIASVVMLISVILYCIKTVYSYNKDIYVCVGAIVITLLAFIYVKDSIFAMAHRMPKLKYMGVVIAATMGLLLSIFIGIIGVLRYKTFGAPDFDFGIFAQMYENMRMSGHPVTTVERQELGEFSHFGVHFSPALYITLPMYMLFPYAETVQIMQALMLGLAVIPLYMLCRHYKLSGMFSALVCVIYCLYPAITAGTFYDFHENCFIPVFLFALILSFEKKNNLGIIVFALLLAMVKEDAAFYVLICGAYFVLSKRDIMRGALSCVGALVYFVVAMTILHSYGLDDLASTRFSNVMYDSHGGLSQIIVTIASNPAYIVSQIFNGDKLEYLLLMLLPVGNAVFQKKYYSRYVLLGTFVIFNLIPSYQYLHNINFQYHFGAVVLILYIAIMTVARWKVSDRKSWGVASVLVCIMLFTSFCTTEYKTYKEMHETFGELYAGMEEALESIPEDSSVAGSAYIVAHMTHHKELMSITDGMMPLQDYVVIDNRYVVNDTTKLASEFWNDYELTYEVENGLLIYRRSELE